MPEKIDPESQKLGKRLKYYREQAGLTQEEMAKAVGLSHHYLSGVERGAHKCTALVLIAYAKKCCVSLDELTGLGSTANLIPELREQLSVMDREQQERVSQMIKLMK